MLLEMFFFKIMVGLKEEEEQRLTTLASTDIKTVVGFDRLWLNCTPEPVKTLTFADVVDFSDG